MAEQSGQQIDKLPEAKSSERNQPENQQLSKRTKVPSTLNSRNINDVIDYLRDKPNTARNSALRAGKLRKIADEEEHPRTAAQTFRLRFQGRNKDLSNTTDNI